MTNNELEQVEVKVCKLLIDYIICERNSLDPEVGQLFNKFFPDQLDERKRKMLQS